jgi:hypothetical protein
LIACGKSKAESASLLPPLCQDQAGAARNRFNSSPTPENRALLAKQGARRRRTGYSRDDRRRFQNVRKTLYDTHTHFMAVGPHESSDPAGAGIRRQAKPVPCHRPVPSPSNQAVGHHRYHVQAGDPEQRTIAVRM